VEIKGFMLCPHPTHHAFPVTVTNGCPVVRPSLISVYILYIVERVLVLNMHEILAPGRKETINQSINQSICIGYHD
jgi:hypothetical protein